MECKLLLHLLHLLCFRVGLAHLVKRRNQLVAVAPTAVVQDALQNQRQHWRIGAKGLQQSDKLLLLILSRNDAQGRSRDEAHIHARIPFRVKLHKPERRFLNKRNQEIFLKVYQCPLVFLDDGRYRHAHSSTVAVALAHHALTVHRASGLQQHPFKVLCSRHVVQACLAKLERIENLSRIAVDHKRLAGLYLKLGTTRQTGCVQAHHRGCSQRQ